MDRWTADLETLLTSEAHRDAIDLIRAITDLSQAMGDETAEALLDRRRDLFDYRPSLTRRYREYIVDMERTEAQRLLQRTWRGPVSFADVAGEAALTAYHRVRDMFDRVDFRSCRRFVMVGCGQLPVTVFHVHDRTDVPELVALDILSEAIGTVEELVERMGLTRVTAELRDGVSHDFSRAQVVYVANMVSPKRAILSRIADTAPGDVQIIVREPYALGRLWAEAGELDLDPRLEITGRGGGSRYLSRDVFLRRRSERDPDERRE